MVLGWFGIGYHNTYTAMKKKQKDRADKLWVKIHMTAIRLTQEKRIGSYASTIGGSVQSTHLVKERG